MDSIIKNDFQSELERIDWDFTGERSTDSYVSFHWYPARFVPQIPSILTGYFSEPGDTVLDPFCGSGTTLLEAYRLDRRPIGIDLHPGAIMMTKAKLASKELAVVLEAGKEILKKASVKLSEYPSSFRVYGLIPSDMALGIPNEDENRRWFHAQTLLELTCLYNAICQINDEAMHVILQACFSAVLNRVCSQNRHYGWICDNVKPKELVYHDAFDAFRSKLLEYERFRTKYDVEVASAVNRMIRREDAIILNGDARKVLSNLAVNSVDLAITSPPYLSVTDYLRSFRLYMLWFANDTWEAMCRDEIGARRKRNRKTSCAEYLDDMDVCIEGLASVLKTGKYLCLVSGESASHPQYSGRLSAICGDKGFSEVWTITRNIAKQRQLYPSLSTETIMIMQRR